MCVDIENMRIVVGCPVRRREWIAEQWVNHVAWATVEAGINDGNVELLFVAHEDDPTIELLEKSASVFGLKTSFLGDEEDPTDIKRMWTKGRIETMVRVRNTLLEGVREREPDYFLSLDSDILLNDRAIRAMLRLFQTLKHKGDGPSATGHCVHLHHLSKDYPNYAMISNAGRLQRHMHEGEIPNVHVLMAAKLMNPHAYAVDYEYDRRGEDIGWSNAVRTHGMHLAWTGKVVSKHCMKPSHLDSIDPRVGY